MEPKICLTVSLNLREAKLKRLDRELLRDFLNTANSGMSLKYEKIHTTYGAIYKTRSFGTLNVQVPIIMSHLHENIQEYIQDILSFRRPALLVTDEVTDFKARIEQ